MPRGRAFRVIASMLSPCSVVFVIVQALARNLRTTAHTITGEERRGGRYARPAWIVACQRQSVTQDLVLVGVLGGPAFHERGLDVVPAAVAGGVLAQSVHNGGTPVINSGVQLKAQVTV